MLAIAPKFNLGQSRSLLLNTGDSGYRIYSTRIQSDTRQKIKFIVNGLDLYSNIEDLLEDSTYRFYLEKPYVHGFTFMFPCTAVAHARNSDVVHRTGWRQINFMLNSALASAVKTEVEKLKTYNRSISMSSFLYTGLIWHLNRLMAIPEKNLQAFRKKAPVASGALTQ